MDILEYQAKKLLADFSLIEIICKLEVFERTLIAFRTLIEGPPEVGYSKIGA